MAWLSGSTPASAAQGWTVLDGPSSAITQVASDGTTRAVYGRGPDMVFVEAHDLTRMRVATGTTRCFPRALTKDATAWVYCRDERRTLAVSTVDGSVVLAGGRGDDARTPSDIFAFGERWMVRYFGAEGVRPHADYFDRRTGQSRPAPISVNALADFELDGVTPGLREPCAPPTTNPLMRRGRFALLLRGPSHGSGEVSVNDCRSSKPARHLYSVRSSDHVRGQLTRRHAVVTSRSSVYLTDLTSSTTRKWRIPGTSPVSREPVSAAVAGGRLFVTALLSSGKRTLLTRRLASTR